MPELRNISGEKAVKILCNKMDFQLVEDQAPMLDFQKKLMKAKLELLYQCIMKLKSEP